MSFFQRNNSALIIVLLLFIGVSALNGCSDSSTNPDPKTGEEQEEEEVIDRVSGVMYLWGTRTTTTYSDWPIPEGDKPMVDSSYIDFVIALKLKTEETDQVRIYGLEGADVGKLKNFVYPDCTEADDCKIYGQMTDVENFEVDINNGERSYKASGTISTVDSKLDAEYQYQNVTISYDLFGERIETDGMVGSN